MVELTLKMKPGSGRMNVVDHSHGLAATGTPTRVGDVVVLQTLSFKLLARVEQVDGFTYVGRIMDCPIEEYVGEKISFGEGHIHTRNRSATS
jgi:hypothetical protein